MSDTSTSPDTGITGAATAFEGLIERSAATEQPEPPAPAVPQETAAPEEAETPEETTTEEVVESGADEGDTAEEDTSDEAAPAPQTFTVELDGKEVEVPLEEAKKGYLRNADYTRKTQALAEARKAAQAELEQVSRERAQYAQLIPAIAAQLQATLPQPPDKTLLETDPAEYVRQDVRYREHAERLAAAQFEHSRVQGAQSQEQQANLQRMVEEGRGKLLEAIPEWRDEAKRKEGLGKVREYGKKLGFTDAELDQAYDHRAVVAVEKARRYDELMAGANRPKPVVNPGPKAAPVGSSNATPRRTSDATKAKQRLAQTGSVSDAASIFERFSNI